MARLRRGRGGIFSRCGRDGVVLRHGKPTLMEMAPCLVEAQGTAPESPEPNLPGPAGRRDLAYSSVARVAIGRVVFSCPRATRVIEAGPCLGHA